MLYQVIQMVLSNPMTIFKELSLLQLSSIHKGQMSELYQKTNIGDNRLSMPRLRAVLSHQTNMVLWMNQHSLKISREKKWQAL